MSASGVDFTQTCRDKTQRPIAEAQAAVWSASVPVGTLVDWWEGERIGEPTGRGRVRWHATVIGDTAVAWIDGARGSIALTHVQVVDESTVTA